MLCKSCGAAFHPKEDRCPYCGAARPPTPIGDVSKTGSVCPTCHSALVKVPEKREYFRTETRLTERARALQAENEAEHWRAVSAHWAQHRQWGWGVAIAFLGFCIWIYVGGADGTFVSRVAMWAMRGGALYALFRLIANAVTQPGRPPLPPGAEETEDVQVLDHTHSGLMLTCLACGWEDWEFNYNEAAQAAERAADAAQKQAWAAARAASAAETAAEAAARQADAQERLLWEQRHRDD